MSNKEKKRSFDVISGHYRSEDGRLDDLDFFKKSSSDELSFEKLLLLNMSEVDGHDLKMVLTESQPTIVVDVRYSPKFDENLLGREQFFSLLKQWNAIYLDTVGILQVEGEDIDLNDVNRKFEKIIGWIEQNPRTIPGRMVVLCDKRSFSPELADAAQNMRHPERKTWSIESYPKQTMRRHLNAPHEVVGGGNQSTETAGDQRKLVFISHANPNDNDFATWLSTKLRAAGYETWVDFENLRAGATFWDEIEHTIRNKCAKFLFLQSRTSLARANVLNEVDLAVSVERRRAMKDYVIPIRIDDSPFDDTYIALRRKLAVDCNTDWVLGLSDILRRLESDDVPRTFRGNESLFPRWYSGVTSRSLLSDELDVHFSNWYEIAALPRSVYFSRISDQDTGAGVEESVTEHGIRFSFVSPKSNVDNFSELSSERLISDPRSELPEFSRAVGRRVLVKLSRLAWNTSMTRQGMLPYELSGHRTSWYWPADAYVDRRISFRDSLGENRSRILVGKSKKYNMYWHFAIEAVPCFGEWDYFLLRPHVVFTTNGTSPVGNPKVMHRLRRSFCKNWWNSRWRDLTGAYVSTLSSDSVIELGGGRFSFAVDTQPITFVSPVTPNLDSAAVESVSAEEEAEFSDDDIDVQALLDEQANVGE